MVTNDEFYETLPDEIRQKKREKKKSSKTNNDAISFVLDLDPNTNTQTIDIKMRRLKFFMRPQVFNEISLFSIACLKKLDLKKEKKGEN